MVGSTVRQKLRGAANGTIGASLHQNLTPNISGALASTNGLGVGNGTASQTGALQMEILDQRWARFYDYAGKYLREIRLDASASSATYGAASTVQPASLLFLPCIKA